MTVMLLKLKVAIYLVYSTYQMLKLYYLTKNRNKGNPIWFLITIFLIT